MSLPSGFIAFTQQYPQLAGLPQALLTPPEVSVRFNTRKGASARVGQPVNWWLAGVYLSERPQFTFDPAMHQGLYYVQDASSMALATAVRQLASQIPGPVRYLDACAAPGGKTTAALDALGPDAIVVANEYDSRRAAILAENVAKWGTGRTLVTRGDTARLTVLRDCFDIVAVDAPCSGEGMMRKDEEAVRQWSPALVAQCADRQREILERVWPALRPGGYLIYSTCTFNTAENEDIAGWLGKEYGATAVAIPALDACPEILPALTPDVKAYRFIPGLTRGEGLFMAVLCKPDGPAHPARLKEAKAVKSPVADWFEGDYACYTDRVGDIHALPSAVAPFITGAMQMLDTVDFGIHAATVKGRDLIPQQAAATACDLRPDAFPTAEVDYAQALAYLRREAVTVPNAPRGIVLLTYGSKPLGFVKNLGNRANNLYPAPWRILSANTPQHPVKLS